MKRSTAIVLVVFLALVGLLLYLNKTGSPSEEADVTPTATVEFLFSESDGIPTRIDIKNVSGEQVAIARNEAGVWVLEQPIESEADQGSAEAAASQVTSLRIESRLELAPEAVGLVQPAYTISIAMTGRTEKTVRIGDLTPTGIGYYARVEGNDETLVISKSGLDALLGMLESPPYITPTATSTP